MSVRQKLHVVIPNRKKNVYPDLKIDTISIDRVSEFNFLVLIISSDLKWSKHIDHIGLKYQK